MNYRIYSKVNKKLRVKNPLLKIEYTFLEINNNNNMILNPKPNPKLNPKPKILIVSSIIITIMMEIYRKKVHKKVHKKIIISNKINDILYVCIYYSLTILLFKQKN